MSNISTAERPRVLLVSRCFVKRTDKKLLLIRRSLDDEHNPGMWECPGGKLEEGHDLTHAAEEEVMQEVGLAISIQSPIVYVESFIIASGKYRGLPYVGIFYIGYPVGEDVVRLSKEHISAAWVSYEEALSYELTPQTRKALLTLKLQFS